MRKRIYISFDIDGKLRVDSFPAPADNLRSVLNCIAQVYAIPVGLLTDEGRKLFGIKEEGRDI